MMRAVALFLLSVAHVQAASRTVVVTGATGQSGSLTYLLLKKAGVNVRGLVRNTTKARELLGCTKCDASDGIFVGDITSKESLAPAMVGADALIIATGRSGSADAKGIFFDGTENQVSAFLESAGPASTDRHVLLISMMETTLLDTVWNKLLAHLWGGWSVGFYNLQGEAFLMSARVPYTILKPCGLDNTPGGVKQVLVGHDDKSWSMKDAHSVSRSDVARVLATAAMNPEVAAGLRLDFCSKAGSPQSDAMDILKEGMYSWDARRKTATTIV